MTDNALTARYDEAATWWQPMLERLGYRAAYVDLLERAAISTDFKSVVDVGTGTGDLAAALCTVCGAPQSLTLVDNSSQMLLRASDKLEGMASNVVATHASLETFEPGTGFDVVLSAHLIEHTDNPARSFRNLASFLRPKGQMLILVSRPHWCQWPIWLKWRHTWFSEEEVRNMGEDAGLSCKAVYWLSSGPPRRTSFAYLFEAPEAPVTTKDSQANVH